MQALAWDGNALLLALGAGTFWEGCVTLRLDAYDAEEAERLALERRLRKKVDYRPITPEYKKIDPAYSLGSLELVHDARERLTLEMVEDDAAGQSGTELDEMQSLFVSEWLTEHPISLAGKYPGHIWLHCDSPPMVPGLENLDALNRVGVVRLREGALDEALLSWRSMEDETKARVQSKREQSPLLACAYNNLAGVYYARHKMAPALQYIERAARLEQRAYGGADFATRLRHGAICCRSKRHQEGLRHCGAALEMLRAAGGIATGAAPPNDGVAAIAAAVAASAESSSSSSGAPAAAPAAAELASLSVTFRAHLAVAYHNFAVQLAYCQQLGPASAMVNVAAQIIAECLSPKHRWCKHIGASVAKLRDLHVATTFVTHSLRPRLAIQQARLERSARALGGSGGSGGGGGGGGGSSTTKLTTPTGQSRAPPPPSSTTSPSATRPT